MSQYKSVTRLVMLVFAIAVAISVLIDVAFPQEKAPRSFVGFNALEYPTTSMNRIKGLKIVETGRLEKSKLPFITVADYVDPTGDAVILLSLVYSNATLPRLVSVSCAGLGIKWNEAVLVVDTYAKSLNGKRRIGKIAGFPEVEKQYADGTVIIIGIVRIDSETFSIVRLMAWKDGEK